jgi:DNA-binding protein YbaB
MFGQLKDLYNLRKQAQELQKQLEGEKITASSSDNLVTLTLNGNHELIEVKINDGSNPDALARAFKDAYNKAQNDLKTLMAQKFQGMM